MIDGQPPRLGIKVTAPMALQGAGLLLCLNGQSTEIGDGLLIRGLQGHPWAAWVEIDVRGKAITLQSRIQVVILGRTVIDAKTRPNHRLSMKHIRSPRDADTRIEVPVVGVIQSGILRTWRRIDRRRVRPVRRTRSQT